jgi:hypothetical protein
MKRAQLESQGRIDIDRRGSNFGTSGRPAVASQLDLLGSGRVVEGKLVPVLANTDGNVDPGSVNSGWERANKIALEHVRPQVIGPVILVYADVELALSVESQVKIETDDRSEMLTLAVPVQDVPLGSWSEHDFASVISVETMREASLPESVQALGAGATDLDREGFLVAAGSDDDGIDVREDTNNPELSHPDFVGSMLCSALKRSRNEVVSEVVDISIRVMVLFTIVHSDLLSSRTMNEHDVVWALLQHSLDNVSTLLLGSNTIARSLLLGSRLGDDRVRRSCASPARRAMSVEQATLVVGRHACREEGCGGRWEMRIVCGQDGLNVLWESVMLGNFETVDARWTRASCSCRGTEEVYIGRGCCWSAESLSHWQ